VNTLFESGNMDQQPQPATPFRWIMWGLFLTMVNGCWSLSLHMEDAKRKGQQRVFDPSPPLLPEWLLYTVNALLLVQLVVSGVAVWRIKTGRWWLAGILLVLWLVAVFIAETGFG
jgi:hypothetical protein